MKNKIIKKLIPVIVLLIIVSLITSLCMVVHITIQYRKFNMESHSISHFHRQKKYFDIVAKRLMEIYDEAKEQNSDLKEIISDYPSDTHWNLKCRFEDKNQNYVLQKEISEEEHSAYSKVSDAFAKDKLNYGLVGIYIEDGRVCFASGSPYAVIYVKNGRRPDYIKSENEKYDSIFVLRLSFKWFEAMGKT